MQLEGHCRRGHAQECHCYEGLNYFLLTYIHANNDNDNENNDGLFMCALSQT